MSKPFIHDDFLLQTPQARTLYHEYAEELPIIDYHCHLPPRQVAKDHRWESITEIWLGGDHYKWRVMRSNGVDEKFCTGDAGDWEKFAAFAASLPRAMRNPMYHWCHLELARYFGVTDKLLGPDTAREIYDRCNEVIRSPEFTARNLMKKSNVVLVCTTDDPVDSLEHHQAVAADDSFDVRMLPTWRPDKGMAVESAETFNAWVDKLAAAAGMQIHTFAEYMQAMKKRHEFFHAAGCRLSDHGIETAYAAEVSDEQVDDIFKKIRDGAELSGEEVLAFKSAMLLEFGWMDHAKGWTQQFHFGALRNNNTRRFRELGPDTGFDSIVDIEIAKPLSKLLDTLDSTNQLAKTILYNLNPRDNELLATMLGNFQGPEVPGKIQLGSGWWFLDNIDGMTRQIEALSNTGLLGRFVGMLTDSRSFLSYTRHEYFRRLVCNLLGGEMAAGLLPNDMNLIGEMVKNISYHNAARYFGFELE
ncbi:MAG: glucuronate isomerase [Phycisphaerae bacterium]|nr:glucuronate isomerase [Phycisphaerae bacterium]